MSLPISVVVGLAIVGALAGAPRVVAAHDGQAAGLPDPARLPARPGLPGSDPGASAPPRDPSARRAPEKGTAVVRGRVVALDTGLPLRRARVMLFATGQPRIAMTDAEGAFAFAQLPAGSYSMSGSKARYVDTMLGARRPGGQGKPVDVAEGQTVEGLLLALPAAGVITGRVVDDAGEPVTGVNVEPMRYRTVNGERQLGQVGRPRSTDDTGAFRIFGLPPGKYYLSARAEESQRFGADMVDPETTGFAPTFYPGTAVAAEAQPIDVVAGAEVVADLQLVTTRLTTVTGIVVDPAGAPVTGGFMMVSGGTGAGSRFSSSSGPIKPDGTFTVTGIAPGEYTLVAQPTLGPASMFEPFGDAGGRRRLASAPIVANGEPISGLRLVVHDPIRIPVNVTFEDAGVEKPEHVFVAADTERGMGHDRAILRDGRLALEVVPGTYRLSAGTMSMGPTAATPWHVKRLSYRGREIEADVVELTAEPGGRVDVVFTTTSSKVDGSVTDESGKPVADYLVIIVPEDGAALRRRAFRRIAVARPGPQGRFRAEHLAAGRYLAAAIADAPIEDLEDADFLESIRRVGKAFTVDEGASVTVDLKLTPVP